MSHGGSTFCQLPDGRWVVAVRTQTSGPREPWLIPTTTPRAKTIAQENEYRARRDTSQSLCHPPLASSLHSSGPFPIIALYSHAGFKYRPFLFSPQSLTGNLVTFSLAGSYKQKPTQLAATSRHAFCAPNLFTPLLPLDERRFLPSCLFSC